MIVSFYLVNCIEVIQTPRRCSCTNVFSAVPGYSSPVLGGWGTPWSLVGSLCRIWIPLLTPLLSSKPKPKRFHTFQDHPVWVSNRLPYLTYLGLQTGHPNRKCLRHPSVLPVARTPRRPVPPGVRSQRRASRVSPGNVPRSIQVHPSCDEDEHGSSQQQT